MQYKNQRGYTLIELLIVIAIITIGTSVTVFMVGNARVVREVDAGARELSGILREAQNYALTGRQLAGGSPCRYQVRWTNGSGSYSLIYWYKDGSGNCTRQSATAYTLPSGVTFRNTSSASFLLPHASLEGGASVTARLGKGSTLRNVCVSTSGLVSDC